MSLYVDGVCWESEGERERGFRGMNTRRRMSYWALVDGWMFVCVREKEEGESRWRRDGRGKGGGRDAMSSRVIQRDLLCRCFGVDVVLVVSLSLSLSLSLSVVLEFFCSFFSFLPFCIAFFWFLVKISNEWFSFGFCWKCQIILGLYDCCACFCSWLLIKLCF